MSSIESIVIAGGGLAAASAAFALREHGYERRITLVGEEPVHPYERPPLSKGYLRGESSLEAASVHPAADYEAQDIELHLGARADEIDAASERLILSDGSTLSWDRLLIATGAAARRLDVPGARVSGVVTLRSALDADAIRTAAGTADTIAVVGGGWIGSEVAASLRELGHEVTLISSRLRPLEHALGPEVADVYAALHRERGVRIVQGRVAAIEGDRSVTGLRLDDGRSVPADLVVVGVGAIPRAELASAARLRMADGGIAVDEYLRTSMPTIQAAGDVASAWHPRFRRRLRVEHWDNAIGQGRTAAANMLGANEAYARTPYLFSDQFDLGMEYRGYAPSWEQVVIRGDVERREFVAFWLSDGRVIAAMNANVWDQGEELQHLVDSGASIEPQRLADPDVPLSKAA